MKLRYPISIFTIPGLVCVPLVLGGCGNAAEPIATVTVTAAPTTLLPAALPLAIPVAVPRARRLMQRVLDAAGTLPVSADQRAQLDEVAADVAPKIVATRAARDAVLEAMATQAEQGTIDRAALQPKLDALRASAADEHSAHQAALTRVTGILTDSQRSALADMMQQTPPEAPRTVKHHRSRHPRLLRRLGLSHEQRLQIDAARAAGIKEYVQSLGRHRGGGFAMTPLPHVERRILVLERALPILTPAQQSIVAQRLRPRAKKGEQ